MILRARQPVYYPDPPSSSQLAPPEEKEANSAEMRYEDEQVRKRENARDEEDGNYFCSSQGTAYSSSQTTAAGETIDETDEQGNDDDDKSSAPASSQPTVRSTQLIDDEPLESMHDEFGPAAEEIQGLAAKLGKEKLSRIGAVRELLEGAKRRKTCQALTLDIAAVLYKDDGCVILPDTPTRTKLVEEALAEIEVHSERVSLMASMKMAIGVLYGLDVVDVERALKWEKILAEE